MSTVLSPAQLDAMFEATDAARDEQAMKTETYVYTNPHAEVERVDALDCEAPAAYRVGSRMVCHYHRLEVVHAYWECDSNQPLFDVDEAAGYRCGETWPGVTR